MLYHVLVIINVLKYTNCGIKPKSLAKKRQFFKKLRFLLDYQFYNPLLDLIRYFVWCPEQISPDVRLFKNILKSTVGNSVIPYFLIQ